MTAEGSPPKEKAAPRGGFCIRTMALATARAARASIEIGRAVVRKA